MTVETRPRRPIPAPPEFPVLWERPEDEQLFWTHDRMHWPDPLPLITFDMLPEDGLNRAFPELDMPMRFVARRINGYLYNHLGPLPLPPEEAEAKARSSREKIDAAIHSLGERWEREWLPEIRRHHAFWDGFDRRGASTPALLAHLDESVLRFKRLWHVHFLIVLPVYLAMSLFDDLYRDLLGDEDPFGAYRLLQGIDNKTSETGRELWKLARRALAEPSVRRVLERRPAGEVVAALEADEAGRAFLADLRAFLASYGMRGDKFATLTERSWIEDPTPAIKALEDLVAQPERDLEVEQAAIAAEREVALAAARERLEVYPEPVAEQFERLLRAAQVATALSEDHNFYIDLASTYRHRRVLLEAGRRLAEAGALEQAEDVVHLTLDELKESLAALPDISRLEVVAARKAEIARFAALQPPPALGTPPDGAPPADDPVVRMLAKFQGRPPAQAEDPALLRGSAGSPGLARGRVRVVRSLEEAGKLHPGDVLVADTTAPAWTPLFATASAVVTDTGGVLSHCAVVAREYGIPAVVGTGAATARLRDGDEVEVDGGAGMVRLLGRASTAPAAPAAAAAPTPARVGR